MLPLESQAVRRKFHEHIFIYSLVFWKYYNISDAGSISILMRKDEETPREWIASDRESLSPSLDW